MNLEKLKSKMVEEGIDTFFVYSNENRRYLTGFTGSNGIVIVTKDRQILMTDSRYTEQAEEQAKEFEVITYNLSPFDTVKKVFTQIGSKMIGYESKLLTDFDIRNLRKSNDNLVWIPTEDVILTIRRIKSEEEISYIRQAAHIADQSFESLIKIMKAGMTEKEVMIELEYLMKKNGNESEPFGMIVASGKRSSLPHGRASDKIIETGDMVTIDFGGIYNGYASDMTRTVWMGEPEKRMIEIFDIVSEAMNAAYEAIRPGQKCMAIDQAHRDVFVKYGLEPYSLRGLGHGVGLQIHELPRVVMGNEDVLEENMVFTIEPGIYIPGYGGVRTEDTVVLKSDGLEILTRTPKKIVID
ncbi:MAG: Xaa-Pro peptidase family protein [Eubacteriales bacterium]|nr:Xaa-Pro peptidase family protein [Eubacteriales bacterium]